MPRELTVRGTIMSDVTAFLRELVDMSENKDTSLFGQPTRDQLAAAIERVEELESIEDAYGDYHRR